MLVVGTPIESQKTAICNNTKFQKRNLYIYLVKKNSYSPHEDVWCSTLNIHLHYLAIHTPISTWAGLQYISSTNTN
jgi:hypothetical protein